MSALLRSPALWRATAARHGALSFPAVRCRPTVVQQRQASFTPDRPPWQQRRPPGQNSSAPEDDVSAAPEGQNPEIKPRRGYIWDVPQAPPPSRHQNIADVEVQMPHDYRESDPHAVGKEFAAERREMEQLRQNMTLESSHNRREWESMGPPDDGDFKSSSQSMRGALWEVFQFCKRVAIVYTVVWTSDHLYQGGWIGYTEFFGIPAMLDPAKIAIEQGTDTYGWNQDYLLDHSTARADVKGTDPSWPLAARREVGSAWRSLTRGGMVPRSATEAYPPPSDKTDRKAYSAYLQVLERDFGYIEAEEHLSKALDELALSKNKPGTPPVKDLESLFPDSRELAATAVDPSAVAVSMQLSNIRAIIANDRTLNRLIHDDVRVFDVLEFVGTQGQRSLGVVPQQAPLLANRVADAYAELGSTVQAIEWYGKAIRSTFTHDIFSPALFRLSIASLLGLARLHAQPPPQRDDEHTELVFNQEFADRLHQSLRHQVLAVRLVRQELQQLADEKSIELEPKRGDVRPPHAVSSAPMPEVCEGSTNSTWLKALTRSLGIRKAPVVLEKARSMDDDKQLYFIWLLAQDAQASMLLAQTTYALNEFSGRSFWYRIIPSFITGRPSFGMKQTVAWLQEASADAQRVKALLSAPDPLGTAKQVMSVSEGHALADQWATNPVLERVALDLLQSAQAMDKSVQNMLDTLEASG